MKFTRVMRPGTPLALVVAVFCTLAGTASAHNSRAASVLGAISEPAHAASAATAAHAAHDEHDPHDAHDTHVAPPQAAAFQAFSPRVQLWWDESFLYIASNGLPAHGMMVGITAWQQQVPLPQAYVGANAWRIPLYPVPAAQPQLIKGRFLRGAIAVAANGIPIFNPQNNRGEISQEIGELDQWGGHCGRADDYHYHAAPLHLQSVVGQAQPIAYALDGYAIYGLTEPDGSSLGELDVCHGHTTAALGYHYHASTHYPYINGGFHGQVVEREGQVDPQPRAQPVRPDLTPLRGAVITGFTAAPDEKSFVLKYAVNGQPASVNYATSGNGAWAFKFIGTDGSQREETYQARGKAPGGPAPRGRPEAADQNAASPTTSAQPPPPAPGAASAAAKSVAGSGFCLSSPEVAPGGALPSEYTGDGAGVTLPLSWSGAPAGTQAYALIMHHLDPEGVAKWYWTLYDIPAELTGLPKDVHGIGKVGTGFKGRVGYEPPHSKGPGAKTYTLTLYALSAPVQLNLPPAEVNRAVLLEAMQGRVLASADLNVVYTRSGTEANAERPKPDRPRPERAPPKPRPESDNDHGAPPPVN